MSTKTQHTPTPWKLFLPDGDSRFRLSFRFPDGSSFTERSGDLSEQDAAFIVRAVNAHEDLIAEMQMAVNELGKDWQSCDTRDVGAECLGEKCVLAEHRVICHLEKAIAKAEGR